MAGVLEVICPTAEAEYFFDEDWTTQIALNLFSKLDFARTAFAGRLRRLGRASCL